MKGGRRPPLLVKQDYAGKGKTQTKRQKHFQTKHKNCSADRAEKTATKSPNPPKETRGKEQKRGQNNLSKEQRDQGGTQPKWETPSPRIKKRTKITP